MKPVAAPPIGTHDIDGSGRTVTTMSEPRYIEFVPAAPAAKTKRWDVRNTTTGETLGRIGWFGRWRKYAFYPAAGMVFEEVCLGDIATFCAAETAAHRDTIRNRRSQTPAT